MFKTIIERMADCFKGYDLTDSLLLWEVALFNNFTTAEFIEFKDEAIKLASPQITGET